MTGLGYERGEVCSGAGAAAAAAAGCGGALAILIPGDGGECWCVGVRCWVTLGFI